jgi:hypothetical protein
MSPAGDAELLVAARSALLDALDAHREALVLIGAQAIYLHTGAAIVALAEATKDSDLAVDPRQLKDEPLLDEVTLPGRHSRRAEELVGDPAVVTAAATALADDILDALTRT